MDSSSPQTRRKRLESLHFRASDSGDLDQLDRLMKLMDYTDSGRMFRLCHSTIDAAYFVATNDRGEIVGFYSEQTLAFETGAIVFGLVRLVEPRYQGVGISTWLTNSFQHYPHCGHMTPMGLASSKGLMKFGKKTIIFIGRPMMDDTSDFLQQELSGVDIGESNHMDEVIAYDRAVFDYDRSAYVRIWCANSQVPQPFARTLVARNGENRVIGYGSIRLLEESYAIQPLYADNERVAESLLIELVRLHKKESVGNRLPILMYVFAENRTMIRFASRNKLTNVENGVRTYVEDGGDGREFRAEVMEKHIRMEKIYCTQYYWPA